MLIKKNAVAKLVNRHPSAVQKYVDLNLLPKPCHRDKPSKSLFWCLKAIKSCLPAVTAYQTKSKSNKRSRPKVNRKSVNPTQRPPETTAQEAARLALDLCVVVK